jgi:hypothetical protein
VLILKVKRANQKDVGALSEFVKEIEMANCSTGHTLGKEFFKSLIRSGFIFMAKDDDKIIGLLLANVDARIQFSNILHVLSHPEFPENDVRNALVQKHMDECKKMNICDIALQAPESEESILKFFLDKGFNAENKFVLLTKTI